VLTIIATIFIPLSFFTGIYGMNFDYIPGLHNHAGFWVFWGVCMLAAGSMLVWFGRKGWLSK
jgi:magnesium transporter